MEQLEDYEETSAQFLGRSILRWIMNDVYENALDKNDGSQEYFKRTREEFLGCELKDVTEVRGGGEAAVLEDLKRSWEGLRKRMAGDDGESEREFFFNSLSLGFWGSE